MTNSRGKHAYLVCDRCDARNSLMHPNAIAGQCSGYIGLEPPVSVFLCLSIDRNISIGEFLDIRTVPMHRRLYLGPLRVEIYREAIRLRGGSGTRLQAWDSWYVSKSVPGILPPIIPWLISQRIHGD